MIEPARTEARPIPPPPVSRPFIHDLLGPASLRLSSFAAYLEHMRSESRVGRKSDPPKPE